MAHFHITPLPIPTPTAYPFEADLVVSIIPPQEVTCVPTRNVTNYLHWSKSVDTDDTANDLYTEIYRSVDLITWELIITRQWLNYDYYTDNTVQVSKIYYYRQRFVRLTSSVVTKVSNMTEPLSVKAVSLLGFEPKDSYSNKFFQYLQSNLPGTRIYDRTNSATFSSTTFHLWQTTCKILESFDISLDGSIVHHEDEDTTAVYNKREVSFKIDKKHTKLTSIDSQGTLGEPKQINTYIVHTILQSFANQFMTWYEDYYQYVTNKYVDSNQLYSKGFIPVVANQKDISTADLWYMFGQLINLQPLKSQDIDQGLVRYKQMLQDSFTNQDSVAETQAIINAGTNTLGITTQYLLEYYKQHFFKSDREAKIYIAPESTDIYGAVIVPYVSVDPNVPIANTSIDYVLNDNKYWASIIYTYDAVPDPIPTNTQEVVGTNVTLLIIGADINTPYSYLFALYITATTTANNILDVLNVQNVDPVTSLILTASNTSGSDGSGQIASLVGHTGALLKVQTKYIGWEDTNVHLYNKLYKLEDTIAITTGTDTATFSCALAAYDPTITYLPSQDGSQNAAMNSGERPHWDNQGNNNLLAVRDDNNEGVSYFYSGTSSLTLHGTKHIILKMPTTPKHTTSLKKAIMHLFINNSSRLLYCSLIVSAKG